MFRTLEVTPAMLKAAKNAAEKIIKGNLTGCQAIVAIMAVADKDYIQLWPIASFAESIDVLSYPLRSMPLSVSGYQRAEAALAQVKAKHAEMVRAAEEEIKPRPRPPIKDFWHSGTIERRPKQANNGQSNMSG